MKSKLFLAAAMLAVLVLTSCEQKESKQVDYYIYEHVEGGANWEKMTYKYGLYTYTGKYFGGSISIGSKPGAWDHHWTDPASIEGYSSLIGEDYWWLHGGLEVTFTFDESTLSMKQINIPALTTTAQVRCRFGGGNSQGDNFTMGLWSDTKEEVVCSKTFFASANISSYFDVTIHKGETFSCWIDDGGETPNIYKDGYELTSNHKYTLWLFGTTYGLRDDSEYGDIPAAQIRFCKEGDDSSKEYTTTAMAICGKSTDDEGFKYAYCFWGKETGTTPYYDLPTWGESCVYSPHIYLYFPDDEDATGWYYSSDIESYTFEKGKRYTYIRYYDEEGELVITITYDGTFNAPAKSEIVAQQHIKKSELKKNLIIGKDNQITNIKENAEKPK